MKETMKNTKYAMIYGPRKDDACKMSIIDTLRPEFPFDTSKLTFVETRSLSNQEMDVFCEPEDYHFFSAKIRADAVTFTSEQLAAYNKLVESDNLKYYKNVFADHPRGLSFEQFRDQYLKMEIIDPALITELQAKYDINFANEVEHAQRSEYELYLKGTAC